MTARSSILLLMDERVKERVPDFQDVWNFNRNGTRSGTAGKHRTAWTVPGPLGMQGKGFFLFGLFA
ncbi:MAG: hypothetical protein QF560_16975 [SAR324 cluster bacterium]|jgi:hypothetical protein|nr:hypothetical protein [SAR324 cluster bacterium]MEE1575563.1 hypothetical protein [Deltaproteobacteria bacterium]MDP6245914.1 hypothetical protein [SAR324 cluster bacterium]MDP7140056.1 hypothetical protein [SAR324 cluster bacterium]MDP7332823.1 hypothetical protein [SAR324 cluster bacterium]